MKRQWGNILGRWNIVIYFDMGSINVPILQMRELVVVAWVYTFVKSLWVLYLKYNGMLTSILKRRDRDLHTEYSYSMPQQFQCWECILSVKRYMLKIFILDFSRYLTIEDIQMKNKDIKTFHIICHQ